MDPERTQSATGMAVSKLSVEVAHVTRSSSALLAQLGCGAVPKVFLQLRAVLLADALVSAQTDRCVVQTVIPHSRIFLCAEIFM